MQAAILDIVSHCLAMSEDGVEENEAAMIFSTQSEIPIWMDGRTCCHSEEATSSASSCGLR